MVIRANAAQAIPMEELEALSTHYEGNGKFWEAAQLINTTLRSRSLPKEKQLGLVRHILNNLDQISVKQPEHYSLEGKIAIKFIWIAGLGTPEFSDFMTRAMKLHKMGIEMNPSAIGSILLMMGAVSLGYAPVLLNPTPEQRAEGAQLLREALSW
jgi:hypothetical protein